MILVTTPEPTVLPPSRIAKRRPSSIAIGVATGRVERGVVKVNDTVEITGLVEEPKSTVVTGLEMFRKTLDEAVILFTL